MPFCTNCGEPCEEQQKFCRKCGTPIEPIRPTNQPAGPPAYAAPYTHAPVPAPVSGEAVRTIIPNLQQNNAQGKRDSFYLIVTDRRSIFAKVTAQVGQRASQLRQEKNSAQNLGFFGRWKQQVAGPDIYLELFNTMTPEQMLADSSENFAVANSQIQGVRSKYYYSEDFPSEWHIEFQIAGINRKFITTSNPEKQLKQVYANVVTK
jgi:hypothetical protein